MRSNGSGSAQQRGELLLAPAGADHDAVLEPLVDAVVARRDQRAVAPHLLCKRPQVRRGSRLGINAKKTKKRQDR